jgi:hypothetical protein
LEIDNNVSSLPLSHQCCVELQACTKSTGSLDEVVERWRRLYYAERGLEDKIPIIIVHDV